MHIFTVSLHVAFVDLVTNSHIDWYLEDGIISDKNYMVGVLLLLLNIMSYFCNLGIIGVSERDISVRALGRTTIQRRKKLGKREGSVSRWIKKFVRGRFIFLIV